MNQVRPIAGLRAFLIGAARGYLSLGRSIARVLSLLGLIAAASAAVVVPVWLLATRRPGLFTAAACTAVAGGLAAILVMRLRRAARAAGGLATWSRTRLLPLLARLAFGVLSLSAIYALAILWVTGRYGVAIPATAVCALAGGWRAQRAARRRHDHPAPAAADDRGDGDRA
jgi:hypothetical protein